MTKLLLDRATGSKELEGPLLALGLPVDLMHLEFGDLAFMGRGEGGARLYIGIELKKVGELVTSLRTKRLQGHQLIGLTRDFDRRYLLIEGDYTHNARNGAGSVRGMPNRLAFEQELINIQTRGGCWVRHTSTRKDTLAYIQACFRYWTDKNLDEHKSHMAMYAPDLDKALLTPPTDFRKALAVLLPGVEFAVSKAIEDYVDPKGDIALHEKLRLMLEMGVCDWSDLRTFDRNGKARKLGVSRAEAIMETLQR